jgi:hypothetical protein
VTIFRIGENQARLLSFYRPLQHQQKFAESCQALSHAANLFATSIAIFMRLTASDCADCTDLNRNANLSLFTRRSELPGSLGVQLKIEPREQRNFLGQ